MQFINNAVQLHISGRLTPAAHAIIKGHQVGELPLMAMGLPSDSTGILSLNSPSYQERLITSLTNGRAPEFTAQGDTTRVLWHIGRLSKRG